MKQDISQYKKTTQREHVLLRPDTYIGSTDLIEKEVDIIEIGEKIKSERKTILTCDGLERIFLEILSNAGDNIHRSREEKIKVGEIKVEIEKEKISVYNEGKHIPIERHPEYKNIYVPQMIFGELLTGSNYNDEVERKLCGRNGIGAKATNIFSKKFIIEVGDPINKLKYKQIFEKNMSIIGEPEIEKYNDKGYTKITYMVDFERFYDKKYELKEEYTEDIIKLYKKHCIDLSFTCNIPVYINKELYDYRDIKKFANLFIDIEGEENIKYEDEENNIIICDTPNKGKIISFVNGIITENHGIHVNTWLDKILLTLTNKYKKYNINKKVMKKHISLIIVCRLDKPKFRGQTKEYLTSPKPKIIIDEKILNKILKWKCIESIINDLNEETNKILKITDGKKKMFVDVNKLKDAKWAGTKRSQKCCLFITEGDSASTSAIKGIGNNRDYYGCYPLKGKPLNTSKSNEQKIVDNKEISDIKKLLGLKENLDYTLDENYDTLRYGSVCILSDQDTDGFHIRGLVLNIFRNNYKSLLEKGFIKIMETPLIKIIDKKNKNNTKTFYYNHEYETWLNNHNDIKNNYHIKYYKGLATLTDTDIIKEFKNPNMKIYNFDKDADNFLSLAFDNGNENLRKQWLLNPTLFNDINLSNNSISHFINNDMITFSIYHMNRAIPSIYDGLKTSQRKIIYGSIKKGRKKYLKVSQLAGFISDITHYHHGEKSLESTIIGLAQSHIGSNNIPLLDGQGQFGSREGKDNGSPRYICAAISSISKYIFRSEDDIILTYKYEENDPIEPNYYFPIIPLFAINGCNGIGTGFSTNIPCYHPLHVINWLRVFIIRDLLFNKFSLSDDMVSFLKSYYKNDFVFNNSPNSPISPNSPNLNTISENLNDNYILSNDLYINNNSFNKHLFYKELIPWYNNYTGEIYKYKNQWHSKGNFIVQNNQIYVNELPISCTISTYRSRLVKKKELGKIKEFKDLSYSKKLNSKSDTLDMFPNFQIRTDKKPTIKNLGLDGRISDTNVVLLNGDNVCTKYNNIYHVLFDFCTLRLQNYFNRINTVIPKLTSQLQHESLRLQFIHDVINKVIVLNSDESTLSHQMKLKNYPDSFLNITFRGATNKKIIEQNNLINKIQSDLDFYNSTKPHFIWWSELSLLYNKLSETISI